MKLSILLVFILVAPAFIPSAFVAGETHERISAAVGIQLKKGNAVSLAGAKEWVAEDDMYRIFVQPAKTGFVYVVHSNGEKVTLLDVTLFETGGSSIILPSAMDFYPVMPTGGNRTLHISVICTPYKIFELDRMVQADMAPGKWESLKTRIQRESRIFDSDDHTKPFFIAGNVKSLYASFIKTLPTYSGKGRLIKTYDFKIKK